MWKVLYLWLTPYQIFGHDLISGKGKDSDEEKYSDDKVKTTVTTLEKYWGVKKKIKRKA